MSFLLPLHILVLLFYGARLGSDLWHNSLGFLPLFPEYVEMVLSYSVSDPIKYHFYCSGLFAVPLKILFAAVLSAATGVSGCWWLISAWVIFMDVAFWQFSNNPPNYSSVVDAITFLIILHSTCTGLFTGEVVCISVCFLSFFCSGYHDQIACSLLGGISPIPEQRLPSH